MRKFLELNRKIANLDTLSQGVVKSHFNLLHEKYVQETEDYRFLWQMGYIKENEFKRVTRKHYNNLFNKVREITKQLS